MSTGDAAWWKIPDWAPPRQIRVARRFSMCAVLALDAAVAVAFTSWGWVLAVVFPMNALAFIATGPRKRRSVAVRRRPPCATVPSWPGWAGLTALLLCTVGSFGLAFLPFLLVLWSVPVQERPAAASYRADRLSSVLYGLACAPVGVVLGGIMFLPAYGSPGWLVGTLLSALSLSAGIWVVVGSSYSLLKLTELALAAKWRERIDFLHVLEEAEHNKVLRRTPGGYVFRDSVLREISRPRGRLRRGSSLPAMHGLGRRFKITWLLPGSLVSRPPSGPGSLDDFYAGRWSSLSQGRLRGTGRRPVADVLSTSRIDRITFDFSVATAIAVLHVPPVRHPRGHSSRHHHHRRTPWLPCSASGSPLSRQLVA